MDLDTVNTEPDVLGQQEIERVLAQIAQEETPTVVLRADGSRDQSLSEPPPTHDFRAPAFLAPNQWRRLRMEHQDFVNSLSNRLSNYLRLETTIRLSALEAKSYRDLVRTFEEPSHLLLFKLEPLRGICVLEIHPHLGLSVVDRLMGGPGMGASLSRDLSEIEVALLDQALQLVLEEWCLRWVKQQDLRPAILGHESSGRYLQTTPADTMMLVLVLEMRLGNCVEEIKIAFPCATLEPLIRQLKPATESAAKERAVVKPKWNPDLNGLAVSLVAAWPERQLSARQVTRLKVGDVLEWDAAAAGQVQLRIVQSPKFVARLGTRAGRWAVEITGRLAPPAAAKTAAPQAPAPAPAPAPVPAARK